MDGTILGIHHITALARDPQRNVDFYVKVLGLRLVKQTVNFDVPDVYHLYYGDEIGRPGTILTFFPFPDAARGRRGNGQATTVSFSLPPNAMEYWIDRFIKYEVQFDAPQKRFDDAAVIFYDPDGLQLELVAHAGAEHRSPWQNGPVDHRFALRGFYGVTLSEAGFEQTASMLKDTLGFREMKEEGNRFRFAIGNGSSEANVDVLCQPDVPFGRISAGSVHHIAWRVAHDEDQQAWRENILSKGFDITPVLDRQYFHSVYFREPGGVLFELATDTPGFTVDEPVNQLGTHLKLPPWLESYRRRIERVLPPVNVPALNREPQVERK